VDNSKWKASWQGVRLFNDMGQPQVRLVKQRSASSNAVADYEVDALSGATFTTKGVENMVNYWTGDGGFGAYLKRLRSNALAQG
jgi:Na+-transporting NADH:ubiquinone oxidoreductase subunit C